MFAGLILERLEHRVAVRFAQLEEFVHQHVLFVSAHMTLEFLAMADELGSRPGFTVIRAMKVIFAIKLPLIERSVQRW